MRPKIKSNIYPPRGNEKEKILSQLKQQFNITKIPGSLYKIGKQRIMLSTAGITEAQIRYMESNRIVVEGFGVYIAKIDENTDEIRLSIEGSQILCRANPNIDLKNIYEIKNKVELEQWMSGQDLQVKTGKKGFLIIKYKEDFLGTGKASQEKISNFIPKERRLKIKE